MSLGWVGTVITSTWWWWCVDDRCVFFWSSLDTRRRDRVLRFLDTQHQPNKHDKWCWSLNIWTFLIIPILMGHIHRQFVLSAATCLYLLIERLASVHLSNPSSMTCDASDTFILTPQNGYLEYHDQNLWSQKWQSIFLVTTSIIINQLFPKIIIINHQSSESVVPIRQFFNLFNNSQRKQRRFDVAFPTSFRGEVLLGRWNFDLLYHLGQGWSYVTLLMIDYVGTFNVTQFEKSWEDVFFANSSIAFSQPRHLETCWSWIIGTSLGLQYDVLNPPNKKQWYSRFFGTTCRFLHLFGRLFLEVEQMLKSIHGVCSSLCHFLLFLWRNSIFVFP